MKRLLVLCLAASMLMPSALAQSTAPNITYSVRKDAMTDANQSFLIVLEENDTGGATFLGLRCDGTGKFNLFLKTKNPLLTQADLAAGSFPKLMYRIDSRPPQTIQTAPSIRDGSLDFTTLAFPPASEQSLQDALVAANKVTIRIIRPGKSNLDYRFPAKGYIAAYAKINRCR